MGCRCAPAVVRCCLSGPHQSSSEVPLVSQKSSLCRVIRMYSKAANTVTCCCYFGNSVVGKRGSTVSQSQPHETLKICAIRDSFDTVSSLPYVGMCVFVYVCMWVRGTPSPRGRRGIWCPVFFFQKQGLSLPFNQSYFLGVPFCC